MSSILACSIYTIIGILLMIWYLISNECDNSDERLLVSTILVTLWPIVLIYMLMMWIDDKTNNK